MARMNVNPTRMELSRLKARLKTAVRGHKLLKDKRDEMMKQFLDIVRQNKELRRKVEAALNQANASYAVASYLVSKRVMDQTLLYPVKKISLEMSAKNIMSVNIPVYNCEFSEADTSELFPYSFATTYGALDEAILAVANVLPDMIRLAQIEKSVQMLSAEIERTRRRVNALEYVMIPQLEETIRYISMKLEENERGNTSRLMKVKDMMLEQAHDFH